MTPEELKLLRQGRTSVAVEKVAERARTLTLAENKEELDKVMSASEDAKKKKAIEETKKAKRKSTKKVSRKTKT